MSDSFRRTTVSQLIEKLEAFKAEHGDLYVCAVPERDADDVYIDTVELCEQPDHPEQGKWCALGESVSPYEESK